MKFPGAAVAPRVRIAALVVLALAVTAAAALRYLPGRGSEQAQAPQSAPLPPPIATPAPVAARAPTYVGSARCAGCHAAEAQRWAGSHHARAMMAAQAGSVLGRFDGETLGEGAAAMRMFQRDGRYFVHAAGPDGRQRDHAVPYTFGITPLQQYLAELPGGRLQALPWAWDARGREHGGQRWLNLLPGERPPPGDDLHWTGRLQNWNFMCADCHSTAVRKQYDAATDSYRTAYAEMNVACEACHGPGSRHLERIGSGAAAGKGSGLTTDFSARRAVRWERSPGEPTARRVAGAHADAEIEICAPCHARRSPITDSYVPGDRFLDHFLPVLPGPPRYHADGQQRDEVYTWGSFLQSRMHAAGVTCSDCHDPHEPTLAGRGNAVCARCHDPARFDVAAHHHHEDGGAGAQCVNCHMPATTYMRIDPRHDHAIRVPQPGAVAGAPDACTHCHTDRTPRWAADAIAGWLGRAPRGRQAFAPLAPQGDVVEAVRAVLARSDASEIVRAQAVQWLASVPDPRAASAVLPALANPGPLVRLAALGAFERVPYPHRAAALAALLDDPVRAVRIEAARLLAPARDTLDAAGAAAFERAAREYEAAQRVNADRPEYRVNLGTFRADLGDAEGAEAQFRSALALRPGFAPAYLNLADLYRALGRDEDAVRLLIEGIGTAPDEAALHHALGLARVRQGRTDEALESLARAAALAPGEVGFVQAHALALDALGKREAADEALARALRDRPGDYQLLFTAATLARDRGAGDRALAYARRLAAAAPGDPAAQRLLRELQAP
ncbi:MAG: tetratricopeptide repeat protein [Gammaproteobacteria bacterium]